MRGSPCVRCSPLKSYRHRNWPHCQSDAFKLIIAALPLRHLTFSDISSTFSAPICAGVGQTTRDCMVGALLASSVELIGSTTINKRSETRHVIKLLMVATGSALAPAGYIMAAPAVGASAAMMIRETARVKARRAARG
jgi:hypothetical protein